MNQKLKFQWSETHISIVGKYYLDLFRWFDFNDAFKKAVVYRSDGDGAASFAQELKSMFMVPRPNKLYENQNRIKKYQLVEDFITFLLHLLFHKPDPMTDICKDRAEILEKELRFLRMIIRDISCTLHEDEHEEFQKLLGNFEAVANEAGSLVYSLFFAVDIHASRKMDDGLVVLSDHINLLKVDIVKFLNLLSSFSRSARTTPNTSVVDTLLIVDSLVYNLEDLMKRDDNRIANAKDQIKILRHRLIFFQSSIRDVGVSRLSEIVELKEPLMQIGNMAHEAEYLIISFLIGDPPLWYLINRLDDINHQIELVGTALQEITKKYKFGDLLKVPKSSIVQQSLLQATRNVKGEDVTIGFEENVIDILHQLVGGTKCIQVISIFGMPGLGKTTLAKKIYNHPTVDDRFDKLSWCVVSQTYLKQSILADILISINTELGKDRILTMEEESLVEHIYKTLKGRRYLVVMDDTWDSKVWDDLRRCFPDDGNGSRILFTTRNKEMAPPNSIIYTLPFLTSDQCWELLEKKVFDNKRSPPVLVGVGKKIAANCCGLPLAVVVIAGILSTMGMKVSTWEEVQVNLASHIFDGEDDSVMQILELSYEHLPDKLKPCFLYFGAFHEDKEIPVGKLMRQWIAQGFISKEEEEAAIENVVKRYLMELIDKSLVMVAKRRSDGGVKTCVVHDLLRDLCLKKSKEENLLKFVKLDFFPTFERGHNLQELNNEYLPVIWSYCQHVRSFHGRHPNSIPFYARDMRLVRVLDFDYIYNHYIGIEFLVYLRYLVISDLPPSVHILVNLEYLHVTKTRKAVYLSSAIMEMRKLSYIQVASEAIYDVDCNASRANNLKFLSSISIKSNKDEEMLKCSPHLRRLKCGYKVRSASARFDLGLFTQLESLSLAFNGLRSTVEELITFPSNIRNLTLSNFRLRWEKMSIIGRLGNLEVLKLRLVNAYGDKVWDTKDGEFQKLRFLKLESRHLTEWNVASSQHFPKLQRLILFGCSYLHEIPCEIGEIATLQLIEVKGRSADSLVESAKRIQQQQWEMGIQDLRVVTDYRW